MMAFTREPSRVHDGIRFVHAAAYQRHDLLNDVQPRPARRSRNSITGKRILETRLMGRITIREENAIAALEVMSRFAADPHGLVYLPPTMSPGETSKCEGMLEHPNEVFAYFRAQGVERVVCEEKHMRPRAIVVVARDADATRARFGIAPGACYTRTGRPFFPDAADEAAFIAHVQAALTKAGFWEEFNPSWLCLDCELMPWSAEAQALLEQQYAAVAALRATPAAADLLPAFERRLTRLQRYREAYRRYCWPVHSLADYRLAPFHLLASEGAVHTGKPNRWHMETLHRFAAADPEFLIATPFREVELADEAQVAAATAWCEELTARGGEGMVVKPLDCITRSAKGLVQPALKCRGREYLRIIYGPEYTADGQLPRLRKRGLGGKRSLALREFALGIESLERLAAREPLPDFAATVAHDAGEPTVAVRQGVPAFEKYVATDPRQTFRWTIHPETFEAPELLELGRLQAWTLKPARLR